jgi:hypothetical protein
LTYPRLVALNKYWQQHPPTHLLAAAYLGYKPTLDKISVAPVHHDTEKSEAFFHEFFSDVPITKMNNPKKTVSP